MHTYNDIGLIMNQRKVFTSKIAKVSLQRLSEKLLFRELKTSLMECKLHFMAHNFWEFSKKFGTIFLMNMCEGMLLK